MVNQQNLFIRHKRGAEECSIFLPFCPLHLCAFFDLDKIQGDIASLVSSVAFGGFLMSVERVRVQVSATTTIFWCYGLGIVLTLSLSFCLVIGFFLNPQYLFKD